MLTITVPETEFFNESTSEFYSEPAFVVELEHSLVSLSKWESKFGKPFLGPDEKTPKEILGYIEAMILTKNYPENIINRLTQSNLDDINNYIQESQTATTFREDQASVGRGEIITSELVYYWLVSFRIPFECETWHLSRLFALIRICSVKNSKQKTMPKHEIADRNRQLNAERRAKLKTNG